MTRDWHLVRGGLRRRLRLFQAWRQQLRRQRGRICIVRVLSEMGDHGADIIGCVCGGRLNLHAVQLVRRSHVIKACEELPHNLFLHTETSKCNAKACQSSTRIPLVTLDLIEYQLLSLMTE